MARSNKKSGGIISWINKNYPRFIMGFQSATDMASAFTTSIGTMLIMLGLFGAGFVEYHRAHEGITATIIDESWAAVIAGILMVGYLGGVPIVAEAERAEYPDKVKDNKKRSLTLTALEKQIRFRFGLTGKRYLWGALKFKENLPDTYGEIEEKTLIQKLDELKWVVLLMVGMLSAWASMIEMVAVYDGIPASEAMSQFLNNADLTQWATLIINVSFTLAIGYAEIVLATATAKMGTRSYAKVLALRDKVINTETVASGVYFVGDITEEISVTLSKIKNMSGALPEDRVNINTNDYFDSKTERWLKNEQGYASPNYLIDKVLPKLYKSRKGK